jgi:hypothetical protein
MRSITLLQQLLLALERRSVRIILFWIVISACQMQHFLLMEKLSKVVKQLGLVENPITI